MPRDYTTDHKPDAAEATVWDIADRIEAVGNRQIAAVVALAALRSVESVLATLKPNDRKADALDWSSVVALLAGGQSVTHVEHVAGDMRQLEQRLASVERELAALSRVRGTIPDTRPAQLAIAQLDADLRTLQAKADRLAKVEQRTQATQAAADQLAKLERRITKLERRQSTPQEPSGRRVVRRPRAHTNKEEVHG